MPPTIPLPSKTLRAETTVAGGGGNAGDHGLEPLPGIPVVEEERVRRYALSLGDRTLADILALYAECLVDVGAALDLALQKGAVEGVRHYAYLLTGTAAEMGSPRLAHVSRFLARRAGQGVAEAGALGSLRQALALTQAAVSDLLERHVEAGQVSARAMPA
ncbi:MAG: hypothetical protein PW843_19545 [Azospirillaceae bacterium]|nr:hypothetical protein [Azospirillaceae bacterium]